MTNVSTYHVPIDMRGVAALIDVETTGLSSNKDEVVELAVCLFKFNYYRGNIEQIIDFYTGLQDPGRHIPLSATRVHGIRDEDVRGRILDKPRVDAIFTRAEFLIAHNASFDRGFVTRLFPQTAQMIWLCSMRDINWRAYGFYSRSLSALLKDHGLFNDRAHRAHGDVSATLKLLSLSKINGETYFAELLKVKNQYSRKLL